MGGGGSGLDACDCESAGQHEPHLSGRFAMMPSPVTEYLRRLMSETAGLSAKHEQQRSGSHNEPECITTELHLIIHSPRGGGGVIKSQSVSQIERSLRCMRLE